MQHEDIERLQRAWDSIAGQSDQLVRDMYRELFAEQPQLRVLFPEDLEPVICSVSRALNVILTSLEDLQALRFILLSLGERHAAYGVKPEYFTVLKEVLTTVLTRHLGHHMTPQLAAAWSEAYDTISSIMQEGLSRAQVPTI